MAITKLDVLTDMENIAGRMVLFTSDSSSKELEKEKGAGLVKAETSTKAIIVQIAKMALDSSAGPMETSIVENSARTCEKGKERCGGLTKAPMRENGVMVSLTAEVLLSERSQECSRQGAKNRVWAFLRTIF